LFVSKGVMSSSVGVVLTGGGVLRQSTATSGGPCGKVRRREGEVCRKQVKDGRGAALTGVAEVTVVLGFKTGEATALR
jgi:hypothetical protein